MRFPSSAITACSRGGAPDRESGDRRVEINELDRMFQAIMLLQAIPIPAQKEPLPLIEHRFSRDLLDLILQVRERGEASPSSGGSLNESGTLRRESGDRFIPTGLSFSFRKGSRNEWSSKSFEFYFCLVSLGHLRRLQQWIGKCKIGCQSLFRIEFPSDRRSCGTHGMGHYGRQRDDPIWANQLSGS